MILAQTVLDTAAKPTDAAFLTVFFLNFDNCLPEVMSDVIPGINVKKLLSFLTIVGAESIAKTAKISTANIP